MKTSRRAGSSQPWWGALAVGQALAMRWAGLPSGNVMVGTVAAIALVIIALGDLNGREFRLGGRWIVLSVIAANAVVANVPEGAGWLIRFVPDAIVTICGLLALLTLRGVSRRDGAATALASAGALVVGVASLAMVIERLPGQRMSGGGLTQVKGLVPHRQRGHSLMPNSLWHTYYAENPRGYFEEPDAIYRNFRLDVHRVGNVARLVHRHDSSSVLRVSIERATREVEWLIQVNRTAHAMYADREYELRFRVRADARRGIAVGITQWHEPWQGLGYYRRLVVDTAWTRFVERFRPTVSDDSARLHFDLGESATAVELADISLHETATGRLVEWFNPNKYSIVYRVDSLGCRAPDVVSPPAQGERRILILGDAFALGLGVREPDTFAGRLVRGLEDSVVARASRTRIRVFNCAVPGYGTREEARFFELTGRQTRADVVILAMTTNDARRARDDAVARYPRPIVHILPSMLARALERESAEAPITSTLSGSDRLVIEGALRSLDTQVRTSGARLMVVLFRNSDDPTWDALGELVTSLRIPMLDPGPALRTRASWQSLFVHPTLDEHPNELVHRIVADTVIAAIRSGALAGAWNRAARP